MRVALSLFAAALVLLLASRALADAAPAKATFSQRFAFLDAPPPAVPELPPAPEREASEWARKSWEIVPNAGFTLPSCRTAPYGGGACGGVGSGLTAGVGGVYRMTPYLALGAAVELANFRYDASAVGASGGTSRAATVGPIFRAYFLESGSIDPWIQVGFGAAFLGMSYETAGAAWSASASGASVSGAAGVDFWLTPHLKVGPAVGQELVFPTEVRVCQGDGCADYTVSEAGGVTRWLRVGLVATVAFGSSM